MRPLAGPTGGMYTNFVTYRWDSGGTAALGVLGPSGHRQVYTICATLRGMSRDEITQSISPEHQLPLTDASRAMLAGAKPIPAAFGGPSVPAPPRPTPIINAVITMPIALFNSDAVVLNPPLHGSVLVGKYHDEDDALRAGLITDIAELIYVWVVGENRAGEPVDQQLFVFRQEAAPPSIGQRADPAA